jgi:hypothetical protein
MWALQRLVREARFGSLELLVHQKGDDGREISVRDLGLAESRLM